MKDNLMKLILLLSQRKRASNIKLINECLKDLEEIERKLEQYEAGKEFIELGKALSKAKEQNFGIFQWTEYAGANTTWYPISDYELERLLKWAEGRE